jgi:hypothetical protein
VWIAVRSRSRTTRHDPERVPPTTSAEASVRRGPRRVTRGTFSSSWTCVMQVAAIPNQAKSDGAERLDATVGELASGSDEAAPEDDSGDGINRARWRIWRWACSR